jgi:hypothetical protein
MDTKVQKREGHSAIVRMELSCDGHVLRIAQLGPDFLMLKEPFDHPPAVAEITLQIDDSVSRWSVQLTEGISSSRPKTRIDPVSSKAAVCQ